MSALYTNSTPVGIRELVDGELDRISGGGLLDGALGGAEGLVNGILGNDGTLGGLLGDTGLQGSLLSVEGAANGAVGAVDSAASTVPLAGGLLGAVL